MTDTMTRPETYHEFPPPPVFNDPPSTGGGGGGDGRC